jgi:hypothetical protein
LHGLLLDEVYETATNFGRFFGDISPRVIKKKISINWSYLIDSIKISLVSLYGA